MVGPKYEKPKTAMPKSFSESKSKEIVSLKSWWKNFEDPVLNELIETAIVNNYDIKIALERIEESRAYYRIKKADLFPEIDLEASAMRTGFSKNLVLSRFLTPLTFNEFQVGFDAIWEVDVFGKLRREKRAAFYDIKAKIEDMRNVLVTVLSDVAKNYVDICAVNNIIFLTKRKVEIQKNILKLIGNRKVKGLDSDIEREGEIAKLQEEEENLLFYETLLKQTVYKLAVLLGKTEDEVLKGFDKFRKILKADGKVPSYLPSKLLRNRPDIRFAEKKLKEANEMIGSAIADFFPSFSLTGNAGYETNRFKKWFNKGSFTWSLGSFMNWPLITFGRIRANVDVKKSLERQALLFYENRVLEAFFEVESAFVTYFNELEKLRKVRKEVLAIYKKTDLEREKYLSGLRSYLFYLEQEKFYIDKKIKKINTKRFLAINLISLYKALGGGEW
jgi:NodT family efflux transporter outer membrane factor (OMF) lipoprotein